MSKRSRKRRRNSPNQGPAQKRSVDKALKKKQPKAEVVDYTRRNIIKLGVSASILSALGAGVYLGSHEPRNPVSQKEAPAKLKKAKYQGPGKDLFSSPKLEGEASEYEKWASKIKLPQMELEEPLDLSFEEKAGYFLPDNIDRNNLETFYKGFEEIVHLAQSELEAVKDPGERRIIIEGFFNHLISGFYNNFKGGRPEGMIHVNLYEFFDKVNQVLLPHGYWIREGQHETGFKFIVYEINRIQLLKCRHGGIEIQLPVVFMKPKHILSAEPELENTTVIGNYHHKGNYITVDEEAATAIDNLRKFNKFYRNGAPIENESTLSLSAFEATLKHEGLHAVLQQILGLKTNDSLIGGKGAIHMGIYTLEENDYKWHTHAELHELAGLGYELMHLDDALLPPRLMSILKTVQKRIKSWETDYGFAAFIVLYELVYMLNDREREDFINTFLNGTGDLSKVINSVPKKKMRTIGERMAKLGIYLTQEG